MIAQRIFSALLAVPLVVLAVYCGGVYFLLALLLVAAMAWLELQRLVHPSSNRYRNPGLLLLCLLLVATWLHTELALAVLALSLLCLLVMQLRDFDETKWPETAVAIGSFFYLALPLIHLLLLRTETGDWRFLLLLLVTTWGYDTCAFFFGIRFGRRRPWSRISPKKSLEGMAGGLVGSIAAASILLKIMFPQMAATFWMLYSLLLGGGVGMLAHLGDLTESAIKRTYQVKDSGQFLPGHGGLLDRIDSVLFAAVFVYYFVQYLLL